MVWGEKRNYIKQKLRVIRYHLLYCKKVLQIRFIFYFLIVLSGWPIEGTSIYISKQQKKDPLIKNSININNSIASYSIYRTSAADLFLVFSLCYRLQINLWLMPIKYSITHNVTSNECIAGNGQILERSDTIEYIKE